MSKNQILFGLVTIVLSTLFYRFLYVDILQNNYKGIPSLAGAYAIMMFLNGLLFGYFDNKVKSITQTGFRYHLITFIIVNAIGIPWFLVSMGNATEHIFSVISQLFFWGIGLFIHWYYTFRREKT